ncbi:hypothetical protein Plim_2100 [Planctopirus limnophila DSM 3776]|uniref:Transmembrane protein (PGPGW) n=2 Tax=Planctopirus limnophila TaxID=120 RepID=D5SYZ5_PLAL2|nr:hypothetical protein Plim_2100 [Planctopirus limnophila DSM 3776]
MESSNTSPSDSSANSTLGTIAPSNHQNSCWRGLRYRMRLSQRRIRMFPKPLRLIFIFCLGAGLIASGIIMLVIPGPGILTILLGLSILSTEFLWAAGVMKWIAKHCKPWLHWINQCWRRMIEPQSVK